MWNQYYGAQDYPYAQQPAYQPQMQYQMQPTMQQPNQSYMPEEPLDWEKVKGLDPNLLIRTGDLTMLQPFITDFVEADFELVPSQYINNPLAIRLCEILQISLKYMSDVQVQLQEKINIKEKENKRMSEKMKKLASSYQKANELLHKKHRDYEKCPICRQKYQNFEFLDRHIAKHHPIYNDAWLEIRTLKKQETPQASIIQMVPAQISKQSSVIETPERSHSKKHNQSTRSSIRRKHNNSTQSKIREDDISELIRNINELKATIRRERAEKSQRSGRNENVKKLKVELFETQQKLADRQEQIEGEITDELSESFSLAVDDLNASWKAWEEQSFNNKASKNQAESPFKKAKEGQIVKRKAIVPPISSSHNKRKPTIEPTMPRMQKKSAQPHTIKINQSDVNQGSVIKRPGTPIPDGPVLDKGYQDEADITQGAAFTHKDNQPIEPKDPSPKKPSPVKPSSSKPSPVKPPSSKPSPGKPSNEDKIEPGLSIWLRGADNDDEYNESSDESIEEPAKETNPLINAELPSEENQSKFDHPISPVHPPTSDPKESKPSPEEKKPKIKRSDILRTARQFIYQSHDTVISEAEIAKKSKQVTKEVEKVKASIGDVSPITVRQSLRMKCGDEINDYIATNARLAKELREEHPSSPTKSSLNYTLGADEGANVQQSSSSHSDNNDYIDPLAEKKPDVSAYFHDDDSDTASIRKRNQRKPIPKQDILNDSLADTLNETLPPPKVPQIQISQIEEKEKEEQKVIKPKLLHQKLIKVENQKPAPKKEEKKIPKNYSDYYSDYEYYSDSYSDSPKKHTTKEKPRAKPVPKEEPKPKLKEEPKPPNSTSYPKPRIIVSSDSEPDQIPPVDQVKEEKKVKIEENLPLAKQKDKEIVDSFYTYFNDIPPDVPPPQLSNTISSEEIKQQPVEEEEELNDSYYYSDYEEDEPKKAPQVSPRRPIPQPAIVMEQSLSPQEDSPPTREKDVASLYIEDKPASVKPALDPFAKDPYEKRNTAALSNVEVPNYLSVESDSLDSNGSSQQSIDLCDQTANIEKEFCPPKSRLQPTFAESERSLVGSLEEGEINVDPPEFPSESDSLESSDNARPPVISRRKDSDSFFSVDEWNN